MANSVTVRIGDEEQVVGLVERGNDNRFSTGSKGFHGQGKMMFNGKSYQVNCLIVEIGSKPATK